MEQRCTNPKDRGYKNYGARGIKFLFPSVLEGSIWVRDNLGLNRKLELDRIDNNGHYAPGNLRYATRSQQCRNTRRAVLTAEDEIWANNQSPYMPVTTRRLFRQGKTREDMIHSALLAVTERRKCWRDIQIRLYGRGYLTL